jgi:hypothetical protein
MKSFTPYRLWTLILGLPLACGGVNDDLRASENGNGGGLVDDDTGGAPRAPSVNTSQLLASAISFPGSGTSGGAEPLSAALPPESSGQCNPEAVETEPETISDVQTVCFYSEDDAETPAAYIEQVVEVVGNDSWVHMRLTLNPDFVDNTYGDTAIGWGEAEDAAEPPAPPEDGAEPPEPPAPPEDGAEPPAPPAPPEDGAEPPEPPAPPDGEATPPAPGEREPRERPDGPGGRGGRGRGGHTFRDLVGSDHAQIQLLDANGNVALEFKIDYLSQSDAAPSGYASLGVSGGEGALISGEPEWVLASSTSIDRNLNGCGLGSFLESSPATDELYTPNVDAADWDYRVSYEIWVSTEAFGAAGFGSALIENVHASPSKLAGDTVDVTPAPCPVDPSQPEAEPEPVPVVLEDIR